MAELAHPTGDDWGSTERLVTKFFKFTDAVADGDTFVVPMAHPMFAQFLADGNAPISSSVELAAIAGSTNTVTIQLSASSTGTLVVTGTGC